MSRQFDREACDRDSRSGPLCLRVSHDSGSNATGGRACDLPGEQGPGYRFMVKIPAAKAVGDEVPGAALESPVDVRSRRFPKKSPRSGLTQTANGRILTDVIGVLGNHQGDVSNPET